MRLSATVILKLGDGAAFHCGRSTPTEKNFATLASLR